MMRNHGPPVRVRVVGWALASCAGSVPMHAHATDLERALLVIPTAAADANAVCNDGSQPVLFYRPGTGDGTDKWLIYLQGGESCWDPVSCACRASQDNFARRMGTNCHDDRCDGGRVGVYADRSTVTPPGATRSEEGIFDHTEGDNVFADWNKVFVHYCSSDVWMGNGASEQFGFYGATSGATFIPEFPHLTDPGTVHFGGSAIFRGVVEALMDGSDLPDGEGGVVDIFNLSSADHVVFAGSSAGGMGLLTSVDWAKERLHEEHSGMIVQAIVDSATKFAFAPNLANVYGSARAHIAAYPNALFHEQASRFLAWNARVDEGCRSNHPLQPWTCMVPDWLLKEDHVETDLMVYQSADDGFWRGEMCAVHPHASAATRGIIQDVIDHEDVVIPGVEASVFGGSGVHVAFPNGMEMLQDDYRDDTVPGSPFRTLHDLVLHFVTDSTLTTKRHYVLDDFRSLTAPPPSNAQACASGTLQIPASRPFVPSYPDQPTSCF